MNEKSLNVIDTIGSSSQKESSDTVQLTGESVSSWSKKPSTISKSSTRKGKSMGRAYRSALGQKRRGFASFRVPKTAKSFVHLHLDSEEKQSTDQSNNVHTEKQLSRK